MSAKKGEGYGDSLWVQSHACGTQKLEQRSWSAPESHKDSFKKHDHPKFPLDTISSGAQNGCKLMAERLWMYQVYPGISGINPPPTAAPSDTAVSGSGAKAGAEASSADMEGSWNRIVVSYTTLCCKIDVNILCTCCEHIMKLFGGCSLNKWCAWGISQIWSHGHKRSIHPH